MCKDRKSGAAKDAVWEMSTATGEDANLCHKAIHIVKDLCQKQVADLEQTTCTDFLLLLPSDQTLHITEPGKRLCLFILPVLSNAVLGSVT